MRFRRHPDPDRVRTTLREVTLRQYAEEIVRLRGAIRQALKALDGNPPLNVSSARWHLEDALEEKP